MVTRSTLNRHENRCQDSGEFIKEYCKLRRSGTPMEQALVLVGHEFRLRQMDYQLALR